MTTSNSPTASRTAASGRFSQFTEEEMGYILGGLSQEVHSYTGFSEDPPSVLFNLKIEAQNSRRTGSHKHGHVSNSRTQMDATVVVEYDDNAPGPLGEEPESWAQERFIQNVSGPGLYHFEVIRGMVDRDGVAIQPRVEKKIGVQRKQAHVSSDPTLVNHCPWCGSGALVGRSDGGIDCNICDKTFRVSEQPMYSNMPSSEPGAGIESMENDPLTAEDPFEAPPEDAGLPIEEEDVPVGGGVDEERDLPPFMSSKNGTPLGEDDFILHHAIRSVRGS